MVMELNLVPLRLLLFVRFAAPLGKTRFSPPFPVGAAPPSQLPLVFQFGLLAPVHVNVCASPRGVSVSKGSTARTTAARLPLRAAGLVLRCSTSSQSGPSGRRAPRPGNGQAPSPTGRNT